MNDGKTIHGPHGKIAYQIVMGQSNLPPIVFLCGFKSDMSGSKAQWLHDYCVVNDRTYLRFDYFAHGQSGGDFMDFTIGKAVDDALFMMRTFLTRPAIVIGSSMGGWVGLRLLKLIPDDIHGFIGIAPAPDFTAEILAALNESQQEHLTLKGYIEQPSGYEEPYRFTQNLLADGAGHCVLNAPNTTDRPYHLLQGKLDHSVPWEKANRIHTMLGGHGDVTFIEDGDHSLSRPQDLEILKAAIEKMSA